MKANYKKVNELATSYLNGNKGYVRDKVKRLNKVEFVLLCGELQNRSNNVDLDEIAFKLTLTD